MFFGDIVYLVYLFSGLTCRMLAQNYNGFNGIKDEDEEEGRNGSKEEGMRMKEEDDEGGEDEEGEDGSSAINLSTQKAFSQLYAQQKSTKQVFTPTQIFNLTKLLLNVECCFMIDL